MNSSDSKAILLSAIVAFAVLYFMGTATTASKTEPNTETIVEEQPTGPINLTIYDTAAFIKSIEKAMVLVEGGKFKMGGEGVAEDCIPVHDVEVSAFYMSRFMLTVEQFKFFVDQTGYKTAADSVKGGFVIDHDDVLGFKKGVDWTCDELGKKRTENNYPILYVNWQDAGAFCNWLSNLTRDKYRLPTEAEWEYAARGGNKSRQYKYSGSNTLDSVAWHGRNSNLLVQPVGTKQPNELGLYDMSGNVWQWCRDWYSKDYYANSPLQNPKGPATGQEIVCRGGCFLSGFKEDTRKQMEIPFRGKDEVDVVANDATFRIVREP